MFVIGYDNTVISEAVLEEKKYSRTVTGREYLEKIIQVGYRITSPDDDQAAALVERFTSDSGTGALFNEAARRLVNDRNQRNPRRIKRFLNSFVLLYALDPEWQAFGPERLVEVLLLDTHFADFMALFRAGSEVDPVAEFLAYRDDRQQIVDDPAPDRPPVEERLRDLQRTLPELYPVLVENPEFVSLVDSLHASPQWVDVCYKLQRRRRPLTTAVPPEPTGVPITKGAPSGGPPPATVLWVIDTETPLAPLEPDGVEFTYTPDVQGMVNWLSRASFDAIVVETGPGTARFDEMASIDLAALPGPLVFYTSRLTPEQRERAEQLGARIVSDPAELQAAITQRKVPL